MTAATPPPPRERRAGRRGGDSGTREAILDAARDLFAAHGYRGATVRAIAARAGVDTGMIRHFFTDKETLFAATMADRTELPARVAAAFAGPAEGVGARVTDAYLRMWDEPEAGAVLRGLVRSAMTTEHGAALVVELIAGKIRGTEGMPLAEDPAARGFILAATHLFGVALSRHVLHIPAVVAIPHQDLVAAVAPAIQAYLHPPRP